jgi:hypothetical protein
LLLYQFSPSAAESYKFFLYIYLCTAIDCLSQQRSGEVQVPALIARENIDRGHTLQQISLHLYNFFYYSKICIICICFCNPSYMGHISHSNRYFANYTLDCSQEMARVTKFLSTDVNSLSELSLHLLGVCDDSMSVMHLVRQMYRRFKFYRLHCGSRDRPILKGTPLRQSV